MKTIKIIVGIAAIFSLFLQCACPWEGSSPNGVYSSREYWNSPDSKVDLLDEWSTVDAKWHFKDGGELTINKESEIINAYWIDGETTLEIIIKGESTVYNVEVVSATTLILTTDDQEIILEK